MLVKNKLLITGVLLMIKNVLLSGMGVLLSASVANASNLRTVSYNLGGAACPGEFGGNLSSCVVTSEGETLAEILAKFELNDWEFSTAFSDFTLGNMLFATLPSFDPDITREEVEVLPVSTLPSNSSTGAFLWNVDNPLVRFWAVKAGNTANFFFKVTEEDYAANCDQLNSFSCLNSALLTDVGSYFTPSDKELSNISFYVANVPDVPDEPKQISEPSSKIQYALFGMFLVTSGCLVRRKGVNQ